MRLLVVALRLGSLWEVLRCVAVEVLLCEERFALDLEVAAVVVFDLRVEGEVVADLLLCELLLLDLAVAGCLLLLLRELCVARLVFRCSDLRVASLPKYDLLCLLAACLLAA